MCPEIYGDFVVWAGWRNGNLDIYGYNLSTQQEFRITSEDSSKGYPEIYGDIVVWDDQRNDKGDIYGYNLRTQKEFQITSDPSSQICPAIYGDTVVWMEKRNGNWDIYGCDLSTFDKDGDGYSILEDCNDNDEKVAGCMGNLVVFVSSEGEKLKATVYVDGSFKGETSPEGKLTILGLETDREHIVRVEAEGYGIEERRIETKEGTVVQISFEMEKKISILDRIRERLDQSSVAQIMVYTSAFVTLIYMIYRFVASKRDQRHSK